MASIQQCVICYDELTDGLCAAPCGHVFHSICIHEWQKTGHFCPICHVSLPPKLLKLFYEPQKDNTKAASTSSGDVGGTSDDDASPTSSPTSASRAREREPSAEEVTRLRQRLAISDKAIKTGTKERAKQALEITELKRQLAATENDALRTKTELTAKVAEAQVKAESTRIELFRSLKTVSKLNREIRGASTRLREAQGESIAYDYLTQFTAPARARPLNGLGQVDVEKVITQIHLGNTQADAVIRGQHEQLTLAMDREQKTKRELRKLKADGEIVSLDLEILRKKLREAKRDAARLERSLASPHADNKALEQAASHRRTPPPQLSPGTIIGDWVAEVRPGIDGGESTRAFARKPTESRSSSSMKDRNNTRHVPAAAAAAGACSRPAMPRRTKKATEDDLVSLGSDDDEDDDDDDDDDESTFKRGGEEMNDGMESQFPTLSMPGSALSSRRSFLTSPAAVAGGGAGAMRNSKRAKFINTGHNAVGGRHKVLLPPFSSSFKNPYCLGGKQSRLGASPKR